MLRIDRSLCPGCNLSSVGVSTKSCLASGERPFWNRSPLPRTSSAASPLVLLQGQRLEPPPHLSKAERAAFLATVESVKPEHFAPEDLPLLCAYCAVSVQERAIAAALAGSPGDEVANLRAALSRAAGDLVRLARSLRLGPLARNANRRRPGTTRPSGERPWDYA